MKKNLIVIAICFSVLKVFGQNQSSQEIVDNQFAQHPIKNRFGENDVIKMSAGKELKRHTEFVKNRHSTSIDTLFHYEFDSCHFAFLHTKGKVLFNGATIYSRNISLDRGVKVGMTKDKFASVFGVKLLSHTNKITIVDSGELCYNYFYFIEGILNRVVLSGCTD